MKAFDKEYWDKNYSEPETMDGIVNAKEHSRYLKAFFDVEHVQITSIIDFGFGYGDLFKMMLKTFIPYRAVGIEPSPYAFQKAQKRKLKPVPSVKLELFQYDLMTWSKNKKQEVFDLGICTSVFQYLSEKDLKQVLPVMAKNIKYLYLTVPTDEELKHQINEIQFKDEYALHRSRKKYLSLISKHFTCVSSRVFESKYHFTEKTTEFTDLLYRF
jgi:hypothetical protein